MTPNKEVINKAEESQTFHLCLTGAASASDVFWNSSKALEGRKNVHPWKRNSPSLSSKLQVSRGLEMLGHPTAHSGSLMGRIACRKSPGHRLLSYRRFLL